EVFGIDAALLQDFHERGFWDPTYTPFTFFDGEKAVANVSMFTRSMVIKGDLQKVACIQSVMTDPAYRGKGYMKQLMERMLAEIDQTLDTTFLITSSPQLYERYGFQTLLEYTFTSELPLSYPRQTGESLARLDVSSEQHLDIIKSCFTNQTPISFQLSPLRYESSLFLNLYDPFYQQLLHYSPEWKVLIFCKVEGDTFHLYDIIGETLPTFEQICSLVPNGVSRMELHVCPDRFGEVPWQALPNQSETKLMVRGSFDWNNGTCKMPITAMF
ncbi:MAG: GNAT family N-acetyltransferase, partial [Clostridia bacterium]